MQYDFTACSFGSSTAPAQTVSDSLDLERAPVRQVLFDAVSWFRLVSGPRLARTLAKTSTRGLDVVVAALLLIMALPLFAGIAIAIKLCDGGPVFFWQQRVGLLGQEFAFPKFRTMYTNSEERRAQLIARNQHGNGITFKMKRDPRVTPVGRWLRRFSLDEVPQLWCVLRGQMSLVGPRPALPVEVARYTLRDRVRLSAIPGLTCIWQVSGRAELPFEDQVRLDAQYYYEQSLVTNLGLLLKTVPAVISGKGAY